jgi:hypothetical protein
MIKIFFLLLPFIFKNQLMKIKFFIFMVLFLGIGAISYAQSEAAAPADKKDVPAQAVSPEPAKTAECPGHQATAVKADCKWVDANNDGNCDICGKKQSECKEKCATAPKKEGCGSSCPMHKECGQSSGTAPAKDGKK